MLYNASRSGALTQPRPGEKRVSTSPNTSGSTSASTGASRGQDETGRHEARYRIAYRDGRLVLVAEKSK